MKNKIGPSLENGFNPGFGNNLPQVVPVAPLDFTSFIWGHQALKQREEAKLHVP